MTTTQNAETENPAIGKDVEANGIRTNYLEAGSGEQTVVLVHGSGPGVTAYANWRWCCRRSARTSPVAPDMVGFGYSDRPEERRVQPGDLGRPDPRGHGRPGHREGPPGRQQLRRRHRAAPRHPAPGPGGQDRADGQHGRAVRDHRGPGQRLGLRGHVRGHAQGAWATSPTDETLASGELAQVRFEASTQPGFQESFSSMFPAPRQRWVEAMTVAGRRDPHAAAPHADRARPRGQGHPAGDLAQAARSCSTTPTCRCSRTAATGR